MCFWVLYCWCGSIGLVLSILTKLGVNKIRLILVLPFFVCNKILSVVGLIQDEFNPVVLWFHVIIFVFCFWFFRYLLFCLCFGAWGDCTLTRVTCYSSQPQSNFNQCNMIISWLSSSLLSSYKKSLLFTLFLTFSHFIYLFDDWDIRSWWCWKVHQWDARSLYS